MLKSFIFQMNNKLKQKVNFLLILHPCPKGCLKNQGIFTGWEGGHQAWGEESLKSNQASKGWRSAGLNFCAPPGLGAGALPWAGLPVGCRWGREIPPFVSIPQCLDVGQHSPIKAKQWRCFLLAGRDCEFSKKWYGSLGSSFGAGIH